MDQIKSEIERLRRDITRLRQVFDFQQRVVAEYRTNSGQPIPNNSGTIIDYATVVRDSHSAVTTGASWSFAAPFTNLYDVSAGCGLEATDTWAIGEYHSLEVWINGATYLYLDLDNHKAGAGILSFLQGSRRVFLNKGDTLTIQTYQNSGGALNMYTHAVLGVCLNYVIISSCWEFPPASIAG